MGVHFKLESLNRLDFGLRFRFLGLGTVFGEMNLNKVFTKLSYLRDIDLYREITCLK